MQLDGLCAPPSSVACRLLILLVPEQDENPILDNKDLACILQSAQKAETETEEQRE